MRFSSPKTVTEDLPDVHDLGRTLAYSPCLMEGWQYKSAFVIQFRPETDIEAGRFEGKIEHVASHKETRFCSLDQVITFIGLVLTEVNDPERS